MRNKLLQYALVKYNTTAEYLWERTPDAAVLRHSDNRKWYGIIMSVSRKKLGLPGKGNIDILDVKSNSLITGSLRLKKGILPGYHMNKNSWITILLDGTVQENEVFSLLDMSYELTSAGRHSSPDRCKNWIVPANPRYYDIDKHIAESKDGIFLWKHSRSITAGNTVYIYITAPISGIKYKCHVLETDIPYNVSGDNIRIAAAMRIKLLEIYEIPISFSRLKEHGIFAVRGPRSMPDSLVCELNNLS